MILLSLEFSGGGLQAQSLYITQNAYIRFFSEAPLENIEAHNKKVSSVLNIQTGKIGFKLLIKNFQFENGLMQEHFNENYMESEKYPYSEFNGQILEVASGKLDLSKVGTYSVTVAGDLTIHGVKRKVQHVGTLEVQSDRIIAKAKFPIRVADYNIKIPTLYIKNIAEVVEVTLEAIYKPVAKSN
ncbi:MAG: YceI family protein [Bacteroidia bacterium]|nr:YceI family protein [Bacteroidia bacterium]MDW8157499.1 YceI family protein [Bacteroidia bacterium]